MATTTPKTHNLEIGDLIRYTDPQDPNFGFTGVITATSETDGHIAAGSVRLEYDDATMPGATVMGKKVANLWAIASAWRLEKIYAQDVL